MPIVKCCANILSLISHQWLGLLSPLYFSFYSLLMKSTRSSNMINQVKQPKSQPTIQSEAQPRIQSQAKSITTN